jgi:hypothetical protein
MPDDQEFWRLDPVAKAEGLAHDIDRLARRARAAGLSTTAYILELAAQEARKGLHKGGPKASWPSTRKIKSSRFP